MRSGEIRLAWVDRGVTGLGREDGEQQCRWKQREETCNVLASVFIIILTCVFIVATLLKAVMTEWTKLL